MTSLLAPIQPTSDDVAAVLPVEPDQADQRLPDPPIPKAAVYATTGIATCTIGFLNAA